MYKLFYATSGIVGVHHKVHKILPSSPQPPHRGAHCMLWNRYLLNPGSLKAALLCSDLTSSHFLLFIISSRNQRPHCHSLPLPSEALVRDQIRFTMAGDDPKEDKDALDALELEAKEFDKVRSRATIPLSQT